MKKISLAIILIFYSLEINSLEIDVPIKIYEPLSKSISTPIIGSSNSLITKKELNTNKNLELHNIIEMETGINVRSIYGPSTSGSKTTIDIRGMGAQAKSNVLILVNGQRLNNIDMSEIDFPSIPIDSIDSVEIIKGSAATVLYGEGAIGGAVNIITNPNKEKKVSNELIAKLGSFNQKEIVWNNSQNISSYFINTYFNHFETDGYRDENEQQQNNFTTELVFPSNKGDHFFTANFSEQIMSTPSDRSQTELFSDRRGSDTPDDYINSEGGSLLYSTDFKIDQNTDLLVNSSFRLKESYSDLQSTNYPSYSDTSLTNYQFTPRIKKNSKLMNYIIRSTHGVDLQYADYESHRKKNETAIPLHVYDAWQSTQSVYSQNSIYLSKGYTLGFGARAQRNEIGIGDTLDTNAPDYSGWQTEHETLKDDDVNYSFNIGLEKKLDKSKTVFARIGNGFRYPNIDDRIGGKGGASLELKTQTSNDYEIGSKLSYDKFYAKISAYLIDGENELAYDSDGFVNINMDSTRRYGLELNTKNEIFSNLNFTNNFTISKAEYTSGDQGTYATDFEGNEVPLVPLYSLNSFIEYNYDENIDFISKITYQDSMRMESDDENFQPKIPGFALLDFATNIDFDKFYTSVSINNIFDETYYNYAVASSSTLGTYNTYPMPGRTFMLTIGSKF